MKKLLVFSLWLAAMTSGAQTPRVEADPFQSLAFLQGTWEANAQGPNGASAAGVYSFGPELKSHIFARHSTSGAACKGPQDFDCNHGDLLYVYQDAPGLPLKAIYFDNEGHVLHYNVTTPAPATVVFLTDPSNPGPQFRLTYALNDGVLSGRFQVRLPGTTEWKSYLEWSGPRKK